MTGSLVIGNKTLTVEGFGQALFELSGNKATKTRVLKGKILFQVYNL